MPRIYPSRCTTPNAPALEWHFYMDEDGGQPVAESLRKAMEAPGSSAERAMRKAEIVDRLKAAANGGLEMDDELRVVSRDPNLWEIRWNFRDGAWRMYHGEPAQWPVHLVSVHFHPKLILGDDDAQRDAQNAEIDLASSRYVLGSQWHWGLS